ncbi:LysR family transcriptional regulator [Halomonas sp. PAMB 3232]|uniref:LysR family transcriptional regulator n=1 Tax=Halomonas sp. PAMB 3232 TaxID=3075221 RepID=UPI0028A12DDF|nr:LysR family transcriptional regulator [Halomonas sp. PAMB 3232]WNL37433.1 LysR family transcriptional regulator [Halomonas sp. PAMB 3232]
MQELNLRYFQSVARTGSLSAAAGELHVAVSAVSRQITNLEQRLELKLFNRQPRGMVLTEAGRLLQAYALRNQLELDSVVEQMRGATARQRQTIRVACPDGMAWHCLPSVIARFVIDHPEIGFDIEVVESARASELVKQGSVDIALTFSLSVDIGVQVVSSYSAAIGALMRSDHPLAVVEALEMKDLADYPLTVSDTGSTVRYLFDVACSLSGVTLHPRITCNTLGVTYTAVSEHSNMVGLCSAMSVSGRVQQAGLVHIPFKEPQLAQRSLQVQVMADRLLPEHTERFLDALSAALSEAEKTAFAGKGEGGK